MKRLFTLSSKLADDLQGMSIERQRTLRNLACAYAVQVAQLREPVVMDSLDALDDGLPIDPVSKRQLEELQKEFDARYFESSEKSMEGDDDGVEYFHKARAVSAILAADGDNWRDAVYDSIYEAAMSAANQQELISRLLIIAKS